MSALPHLTAAQNRDLAITLGADPSAARREYFAEVAARRANPAFVECPRCREHHAEAKNFEHICDRCRLTLLDDFPRHPFTLAMLAAEGWPGAAQLTPA